jgi:osmotically-inducible protein OsmY
MSDEPAQYMVARVRDALAHDEQVAALDIAVRLVGQNAFVTGTVTTAARRSAAEAVVARELPGFTVHNQLAVLEPVPPGDVEAVT